MTLCRLSTLKINQCNGVVCVKTAKQQKTIWQQMKKVIEKGGEVSYYLYIILYYRSVIIFFIGQQESACPAAHTDRDPDPWQHTHSCSTQRWKTNCCWTFWSARYYSLEKWNSFICQQSGGDGGNLAGWVLSLLQPIVSFTILENMNIWYNIQIIINPFLETCLKRQGDRDNTMDDKLIFCSI